MLVILQFAFRCSNNSNNNNDNIFLCTRDYLKINEILINKNVIIYKMENSFMVPPANCVLSRV